MKRKMFYKKDYVKELLKIIRTETDTTKLPKLLSDYHEKDIAEAITLLSETERRQLYPVLGAQKVAEIFSYLDDSEKYIEELDVLDDLTEHKKQELVSHLDEDAQKDVRKLLSYDEDEIGSCMTNNFVCISDKLSIREAMRALVRQAGEHDNISTIYVVDKDEKFVGAIDLKDLIIARENDVLEDIISRSYPFVCEHEKINDCIDKIADYEEDSLPVLTKEGRIAGILTATDIVELVDDAMGDDYAKLGGLTSEEDLNEPTIISMKKRLPWLIILLFLGMGVSSVVGIFESVVAVLPIVICFQSLVLDMAGNVGTQSLAVTIRVLMDENLNTRKKLYLLGKEMRIGFFNGISLGLMALVFLGVSSMVGTLIPMFFKKINVDPAVASGPLITTVNDLVAVVTYYGLAMVFLIDVFHI